MIVYTEQERKRFSCRVSHLIRVFAPVRFGEPEDKAL